MLRAAQPLISRGYTTHGRKTRRRIKPTISIAWNFTTKSGGVWKNLPPETVVLQLVGEPCRPNGTIFALGWGRCPRMTKPLSAVSWRSGSPSVGRLVQRKHMDCPPSLILRRKEGMFSHKERHISK